MILNNGMEMMILNLSENEKHFLERGTQDE